MRISPVTIQRPFSNYYHKNQNNNGQTKANKSDYKTLSYGNIPFCGFFDEITNQNLKRIKSSFNPEGDEIYNLAQAYARRTGAQSLSSWHLYAASLLVIRNYIKELEEEKSEYGKDFKNQVPFALEDMISVNDSIPQLRETDVRKKYLEVIDKHIKELPYKFKTNSDPSNISKSKYYLTPSKKTLNDMATIWDITSGSKELDPDTYYGLYLFTLATCTSDKTLSREFASLIFDLREALMVDKTDKKAKNHLSVYDEKADIVWKNISLDKDTISIYELSNPKSAEHFVSSFVNLINKPNQTYKNIDPEKTDIVLTNKNVSFDFLHNYISNIDKNPAKNGRRTVIVSNLGNLIANNNGQITIDDVSLINGKNKVLSNGKKVNLVFTIPDEAYYANTAKGAFLANSLSKLATQTIPSLNAGDTFKHLTNKRGSKYLTSAIGKEVKPDVVQKAIEYSSSLDGNYPDKTISLLQSIVNYYGDKEEITIEDVDNYIAAAKGLNEFSQTDKNIEITYDTGKTLKDIVGSKMAYADAESIVKLIKNGIGVRGYRTFIEDPYDLGGGGRKHVAEAIAGEAKIPMLTINAQDFALKDIDTLSQNADFSEIKMKQIVDSARAQALANKNKTAMIYIENFDNFASDPVYGISSIYEQKAFSQLLSEMKKIKKAGDINLIIIGSLNRPELVDKNILKPNKFLDSIMIFPPQTNEDRKDLINYYINKMDIKLSGSEKEQEENILYLSETTHGFSVVDLISLLETIKNIGIEKGKDFIDKSDMTESYLRTVTGRVNSYIENDSSKKIIAAHEAGHAITGILMYELAKKEGKPWTLPYKVNFITLDPRANYGGAVYYKGVGNFETNYETIMADIVSSYGGNSAENILYGMNGSSGIFADIEGAQRVAEFGVRYMGIGPNVGVRHISSGYDGKINASLAKQAMIEKDVDMLLDTGKAISDKIVSAYKEFIQEFSEKYYSKVGTGDCIIPSETFEKELKEWISKQSKSKKESLENLNSQIVGIMKGAKTKKD